jgi:hypothetical protein
MSENIFEQASRLKLRFAYKGSLSVEDLWDLSDNVLDGIFVMLDEQAETLGRKSLLNKRSKTDKVLALKLKIVEHVFNVKEQEKEARRVASENRAERQEILEVVAEMEKDELRKTPIAKLKKRAAKLAQ